MWWREDRSESEVIVDVLKAQDPSEQQSGEVSR